MWKSFIFVAACAVVASGRMVKRQAQSCSDECKNTPMEIAFILDDSTSISKANFTKGLWFLENFADMFTVGPDQVRFSMVTYSTEVHTEDAFHFNTYSDIDQLKVAIGNMPHRTGNTATWKAIRWVLKNDIPMARQGVRTVLIVLTDGNSQSKSKTAKAADEAVNMGLEVFAIGVGHNVSQDELRRIASDGEHIFVVNDFNALDDIKNRLAYETCGVKPDPICGFSPIDISFVIDSSSSVGNDFTLELEFIKEFLEVFKINPHSTRVAAIMFGRGVYEDQVIQFDQHKNKKDTLDAILALNFMAGDLTDTGAALDYVVDHFAPKSRPYAAHVAIIITDGKSQATAKTKTAAIRARDHGIKTVAVGVGTVGDNAQQLSAVELENIAGDASRWITADNFAELAAIRDKLTDVTCEEVITELQGKGK